MTPTTTKVTKSFSNGPNLRSYTFWSVNPLGDCGGWYCTRYQWQSKMVYIGIICCTPNWHLPCSWTGPDFSPSSGTVTFLSPTWHSVVGLRLRLSFRVRNFFRPVSVQELGAPNNQSSTWGTKASQFQNCVKSCIYLQNWVSANMGSNIYTSELRICLCSTGPCP